MKISKAFQELENRIKDQKIELNTVDKSILEKISKCSEAEINSFVKTGALPTFKLSSNEMKAIKAGWIFRFSILGTPYVVKGGDDFDGGFKFGGGKKYTKN